MSIHRLLAFLVLAVLALAAPVTAQERSRQAEARASSAAGVLDLIPADSVTEHALRTEGGTLAYTATAGTLDLFGQGGERTAKVFYTAYAAKDAGGAARPVTFAFNGGPGAASAYLHLGLVGPRVLEFGPERNDGTAPALRDNPDSWLDFTDLVLIDPVGTGWSRAAGGDAAAGFYGVRQDAESLAKVIALYSQKNGRMASPKYLLGESYGGFRAAKVAMALKDTQGILVSGVLMVSPMIEGRFVFSASGDPLSAALQFPSLVAGKLERDGAFDPARVAAAEDFAMDDYLAALARPARPGPAADAFYARVSELTGIPARTVARTRGFVGGLYARHSAGGGIVSPYDAGVVVTDAWPETDGNRNGDPVLDGFTRAYGAAFAAYARDELGFASDVTYALLNTDVNRRWQWNGGRGGDGRANAGASGDLRELLSVVPSFRLAVYHGYSDVLTPYGASRYVIDQIPPALSAGRTDLKLYRGGHMFYTDPAARRAMTADARAFYAGAAAANGN